MLARNGCPNVELIFSSPSSRAEAGTAIMPHAPPTAISAGSSCLRPFLDLLETLEVALFFSLFDFDAFTSSCPGSGIAPIGSVFCPVLINYRPISKKARTDTEMQQIRATRKSCKRTLSMFRKFASQEGLFERKSVTQVTLIWRVNWGRTPIDEAGRQNRLANVGRSPIHPALAGPSAGSCNTTSGSWT